MIADDRLDWLKLVLVPGLGPVTSIKLLNALASPGRVFEASESELQAIDGVPRKLYQSLKEIDQQQLEQSVDWLEAAKNHHLLCLDDDHYPALLKTIPDPPPVLFVHGDVTLLDHFQLAMVGSRNASNNGYETAYEFARYLTNTGLAITSGLALGIDGASHQGALDAGGQTIAVTGNGLDRVYPARHHDLAHAIAENGALVSEFAPGTRPVPGNFPRRNRIIAGLSLGTLVVEAAQKSGSLITAYRALDYSREVFAIPGSIHNPLARGCHQLIRQGAKLVETARDVLEELAPMAHASVAMHEDMATTQPESQDKTDAAPESHQAILDAMAFDPVSVDTLVTRTGMASSVVSSILLILELQGKISCQSGGHYLRAQHSG